MLDLHLHSHHSDGTWSPADLVEHAVKIGMKHIALTDHDTVSGIDEALVAARNRLEIIPAIELNTIFVDEFGSGHDVHILGYFIDKENVALLDVIERQKKARAQHVLDCIDLIAKCGVEISVELVQECAGVGAAGTAHITEAIVRAGGAPDATSAYEKFMVRTSPYYAARKSIKPEEAVAAIRMAGGIASIAHPGSEPHVVPLIESLQALGLSALEAHHRVHGNDLRKYYVEFARQRGMLVTGGSDCHGPFQEYPSLMGSPAPEIEDLSLLRRAHLEFSGF